LDLSGFVARDGSPPPSQSHAAGVGHPVQPLPDVGRAEARSAKIDRCDGVTLAFQVRVNKVDPLKAVFTRNLFAKDHARSRLADEMEERWP
jgi:hypothetical protein